MTLRENYLLTFEHKTPEWLPNGMMDVNFLLPMQEIERYDDMESGEDGFGVHWTYDEDACYDFFGAVADHKIRMMERTKKYYHADIFNMHDDYGMNDRPFMSLELWRKLLKPHLKRIVEACHDFGMYYQHHSCGFIEPFVDDFVEIGVDGIDTWQVCNKNIRAIKDKYQHCLTFIGGLDNMGILDKEGVTKEEVIKEFHRAIDLLAPGGSYIPYPITLKMDYFPGFKEVMDGYGKEYYKLHPEAISRQ